MGINEKEIEKEILDWMNRNGYFAWKENTVGIYDEAAKAFRAKSKFDLPGKPDIMAIKDGIFYAIEVKTMKGRASDAQKAFIAKINKMGGHAFVARSLSEAQERLKETDQALALEDGN